jgi:ubiquitin C-terminal hydrolase
MEYNLKSVINHVGSPTTGHFVCFVHFNGSWMLCDDLKVALCKFYTLMKCIFLKCTDFLCCQTNFAGMI